MYNKFQSRVIIIGGSGLIGSHLSKYLKNKNINTISTCNKNHIDGMVKFDFTNDKLTDVIDKPMESDIFLILAAVGNPNWISENKNEAYKINVDATKSLINQISKFKSKIYFMSSVEVFDGGHEKIVESMEPNPLNFYGKTKLIIENYLKESYSNYHIIRTGWNTGINSSSRCVIKMTYETLLKKDAKMAFDNSFTITHVDDLVSAIEEIIFSNKKRIVHLCCQESITRTKLADAIIYQSKNGKIMNYKECQFSDIVYTEPRSRLNNLRSEYKELNLLKFRKIEETVNQKVKFLDNL
tara:strand:+ start:441 stop:1331 length:891 start_codon:yes stop_codon:yes gene_type:complete